MELGKITWADLTVENAEDIRDFYSRVVGWEPEALSMGLYEDYNMKSIHDGEPCAGICHARGVNKELPPQWLIYITVDSIEDSVIACKKLGGEVIKETVELGNYGRYCVIKDPAGAAAALFEKKY